MPEEAIKCPRCGHEIPLSEAFTRQIEERLREQFAADLMRQQREFDAALAAERARLAAQAKQQAAEALAVELNDLRLQLAERERKLEESRRQELDLRKRQRELEDRERAFELETARQLDEERKKIWQDAAAKVAEEHQLRLKERDVELHRLREQIEQLQRKAELGPQERQGEAQEQALEEALRDAFRHDTIEPVGRGRRGADVLQKVVDATGNVAGSILWESKRTKDWSGTWIAKLKDDRRAAHADLAVLVSEALPAEIQTIGQVEGVWVCDFRSFLGLAMALRQNLVELAGARRAMDGQQGKMEMLYAYLSGPQFRQRVEALVEVFQGLQADLARERTAMEKLWAQREKQIERVLRNTAGMYGDLQGLMGNALPAAPALELAERTAAESGDSPQTAT